jgi:hypothetical protein
MAHAVVKRQVVTCDRCAFNNVLEASQERRFAIDDRYYELDLCEKHAEMFDRELGGWTRLAAEIDDPYAELHGRGRPRSEYFTEQRRAETRRIRELAERADERARVEVAAAKRAERIDEEERLRRLVEEDPAEAAARRAAEELTARRSIPGAMKWKLTEHAIDRMELRGYTIYDALLTASQPHKILPDPKGVPNVKIHERSGCRVVLNVRSYDILTVIDRYKAVDLPGPYQLERQAQ